MGHLKSRLMRYVRVPVICMKPFEERCVHPKSTLKVFLGALVRMIFQIIQDIRLAISIHIAWPMARAPCVCFLANS